MHQHYLHYLTDVMAHQWNDAALTDYGENHEYTFGELAAEMLRLHILFENLGIKRGDKIALCGRNCANWALVYLAIASYEGVCVSILQDFNASDIAKLLEHSDSDLLFVGPYVWHELKDTALPERIKAAISLEDFRPLYKHKSIKDDSLFDTTKHFKQKYPHGIEPEDIQKGTNILRFISFA